MSVCNILPNTISRKIKCFFFGSSNSSPTTLYEWKMLLPLLQVCSSWREGFIPIVYETVFFDCQETHRSQKGLAKESNEGNPGLISNAQLAFSTGYMEHVNTVAFNINCVGGFDHLIYKHIELMKPDIYSWDAVKRLNCSMGIRYHEYSHRKLAADTGSFLVDCLSNLKKLCLLSHEVSLYVNILYGSMICRRPQSLCSLKSNVAIDLFDNEFSAEFTDASIIAAYGFKQALRKVNRDTLRCLEITQINGGFSWDFLHKDSNSEFVSFPALEHLKLEFIKKEIYYDSSPNIWDLVSFPKLKHLQVKCVDHMPPSVTAESSPFPQSLKSITLIGHSGIVEWWNTIPVVYVDKVDVKMLEQTNYLADDMLYYDSDTDL